VTKEEEAELVMIASRWEAICELLEGKEVSDFMLSFPEVRKIADAVQSGNLWV
jgi:hypothetical protein